MIAVLVIDMQNAFFEEPALNRRQEEVDRALASILELRKRTGKVTLEEIRSAREEGRKY